MSYVTYMAQRKHCDRDIDVIENSPNYPLSLYQEQVAPTKTVLSVIWNPSLQGFPVERERMFAVALPKNLYCWVGPMHPKVLQRSFASFFECKLMVSADAYAGSDNEEGLRSAMQEFA